MGPSVGPLKTPPGNDSPGSGELAGLELAQTLKGSFTARKTLDGRDRIRGFKKRERKKKTGREKLREPTVERQAGVLPLAADVTESGRRRRRQDG